MKTLIQLFILCLIATLPPPAGADSSEPVKWWRLDSGDLRHPGKGDSAIVCRTVEEATAVVCAGNERKPVTPAWVSTIDFEAWMIIVIPCTGNAGAQFDVEKTTDEDGKIFVWCIREKNADENDGGRDAAMAILVRKTEAPVKAVWSEGTLKALRERRDCAGGHEDKDMEGGRCGRCGKSPLGSPKCRLCGDCASATQSCMICLKRVAGDPPLKK